MITVVYMATLRDNGVVYNYPQSKAELMPHQEMPPFHIDTNGIVQLLLNLKPLAPGPDKIPTRLLKELSFVHLA